MGEVIKLIPPDEVSLHAWVSCSVSELAVLESLTAVLDDIALEVLMVVRITPKIPMKHSIRIYFD